jgi:hypothetical protein
MGTHHHQTQIVGEPTMTDQEYLEVTRKQTNNLGENLITIIVANQTTMQEIPGIEYAKKARHTIQDTSSERRGAEI